MFVGALLWGHFVEVGTASIKRNQLSDNSPQYSQPENEDA